MPSNNRPYLIFTFLKPRSKKVVLLPEIGWVKFFLSLTARIVKIVSEYIFFVSKKKERKQKTQTHKQTNRKRT